MFSTFDIAMMSRGAAARQDPNSKYRIFDWIKAVELIKEHDMKNVTVGLEGDFEATRGTILEDGEPTPTGCNSHEDWGYFFASIWAAPTLRNDDDYKEYECWIYDNETENPNKWTHETWWPEEAVKLLNEKKKD